MRYRYVIEFDEDEASHEELLTVLYRTSDYVGESLDATERSEWYEVVE